MITWRQGPYRTSVFPNYYKIVLYIIIYNVFIFIFIHIKHEEVTSKRENRLWHMFKQGTQNRLMILNRSCQFGSVEWAVIIKQLILAFRFKL